MMTYNANNTVNTPVNPFTLKLRTEIIGTDGRPIPDIQSALLVISRLSGATADMADTVECSQSISWEGIWPAFSTPAHLCRRLADAISETLEEAGKTL